MLENQEKNNDMFVVEIEGSGGFFNLEAGTKKSANIQRDVEGIFSTLSKSRVTAFLALKMRHPAAYCEDFFKIGGLYGICNAIKNGNITWADIAFCQGELGSLRFRFNVIPLYLEARWLSAIYGLEAIVDASYYIYQDGTQNALGSLRKYVMSRISRDIYERAYITEVGWLPDGTTYTYPEDSGLCRPLLDKVKNEAHEKYWAEMLQLLS